jgi:hypothetical protein
VGAALRRRDLEVGAAADQGAGSGVAVAAAGSALGRQGATTSDVGRKKRGGWGWMDWRGERLEFHVYIYVCDEMFIIGPTKIGSCLGPVLWAGLAAQALSTYCAGPALSTDRA